MDFLKLYLLQLVFITLVSINIKNDFGSKTKYDTTHWQFIWASLIPVVWMVFWIYFLLTRWNINFLKETISFIISILTSPFTFFKKISKKWKKAPENTLFKFWDVIFFDDKQWTERMGIVLHSDNYNTVATFEDASHDKWYLIYNLNLDEIRVLKGKIQLDDELKLLRKASQLKNQADELIKESNKIKKWVTGIPNVLVRA